MNFVAIDVETANPDMASICQIGLVRYKSGVLEDEWKSYVDPEGRFHWFNTSIHGIDQSVISGSPTFPELAGTLRSFLDGTVVISHSHFDRVAINRAAERYAIAPPESLWLDSARIARRAFSERGLKGYGLGRVCEMLGYEFRHHDALEDARAAAHIVLAASAESGLDIEGWLAIFGRLSSLSSGSGMQPGNPQDSLGGEVLVFTGALATPRREEAELAASAGCEVAPSVTGRTTILVVGDQDPDRLAGHKESSKLRKARKLIADGVAIRIIGETDFIRLVQTGVCERDSI